MHANDFLGDAMIDPEQVSTQFPRFDLVEFILRQKIWSLQTFGSPGEKMNPTAGVIDHLKKEIAQIAKSLGDKLEKNKNRKWPPVDDQVPGQATEHIREIGSGETKSQKSIDMSNRKETLLGRAPGDR